MLNAVSQPKNLKINLHPHQLANVYKMEEFERTKIAKKEHNYIIETKMGINADPTGYGKTLSMIALILRDKMEWKLDKTEENIDRVYSNGLIKIRNIYNNLEKISTTLILVPPNIIKQWENELNETPLKVKYIKSKGYCDFENLNVKDYDVIVVVPNAYNILVSTNKFIWKRFIFDEPGHLKVPNMINLKAGFIWMVSATPYQILTKHKSCRKSFMNNLFDFSYYDNERMFKTKFDYIIIKNSLEIVSQSFKMPTTYHYYHECYQPILNTVKNCITHNVKTLIEAGNIEKALTILGGKKTDNIIELIKNNKLAELKVVNSKIRIFESDDNNDREELLDKWIKRKDRINLQIADLETKFNNMLSGDCSICFEPLKNPILEPKCQNLFCGECLLVWLQNKKSCPLCRNTIDNKDLVYVKKEKDERKVIGPKKRKLTKMEKILELIKDNEDGRFLIFSSDDKTFVPATRVLIENNIVFKELKGKGINNIIESYKKGEIQGIFLNSKFHGAGINLQETTHLIIYHKMTDDMQTQIIGRANRIGRTEPLHVHHL